MSIRDLSRKAADGVLSLFDLQLIRKSTLASANRLVIEEPPPPFPPESEAFNGVTRISKRCAAVTPATRRLFIPNGRRISLQNALT